MHEEVNVWSEVDNHLPMFNDMVCAKYHFDEDRSSPQFSDYLYQSTLSEFECYGDVKFLGLKYTDPLLILVSVNGCLDSIPPLQIQDIYDRTYELQFLLLCNTSESVNHMTACSKLDDRWVHYDNNPEKLHYEPFNIETADFKKQFVIYLAGYVNTSQSATEDGMLISHSFPGDI
ncbi:hypothetical protein NFI96_025887 [Prochilodus magdalenae]|nr:hypothetical protein NFI96_025887 [Prochilodus magdalenae]